MANLNSKCNIRVSLGLGILSGRTESKGLRASPPCSSLPSLCGAGSTFCPHPGDVGSARSPPGRKLPTGFGARSLGLQAPGHFGERPGAGRAGLASGLLPGFAAASGHLPPAPPPPGVAIGSRRVRTRAGPGGRLPGRRAEQDQSIWR